MISLGNLLGIPSSLGFAVIGSVILFGVLADQQIVQRGGFGQAFKRTRPWAQLMPEKQA